MEDELLLDGSGISWWVARTAAGWARGVDHRRAGQVLSTEREPLEVLEALRLQIGSYAFSAQYQQSSAPPGGFIIQRHRVKRYAELPPKANERVILQSWDTSSKGGPEKDWLD